MAASYLPSWVTYGIRDLPLSIFEYIGLAPAFMSSEDDSTHTEEVGCQREDGGAQNREAKPLHSELPHKRLVPVPRYLSAPDQGAIDIAVGRRQIEDPRVVVSQPTPFQISARNAIVTTEGSTDEAITDFFKKEYPTKISWNYDPFKFILHVWNFDPMQIPRTPHRTEGSPFADCYALPREPTRDFCAALERLSYGHLIDIFEELRKQLFGDPDYTAGAVSASTHKEATLGNLMRIQTAISGTLSGIASPVPALPPLRQILDTRMIAMLDVAVEGGYSITKPDLMYNTNHDRDSQRWTWSIVPGEVKKKLPGVWEYGTDFRINLDRLQQRYLKYHYIDPDNVGEKRKRDSKNDPELSKSRKRARPAQHTISRANSKDWLSATAPP
ncbi:hypothetical protein WOLCODRAFT_167408 [Wolfiporia cocos MD-104 SS10]|uniref:Uncharacterized protein n=1 Tax=Wolfiporia cocos (strain MD-104) TaxID=742152 RepID=A0A2H3J516_WOLCO|nr:hypothetical protein WOLCODRAFT_167408 [Wolfiporia cocos MD-104 SS10]